MEMFTCDRRNMKLTRRGCATLFRSARDDAPKEWEGRAACVHCPIGAANAGETVNPIEVAKAALKSICTRCGQVGSRIVRGRFCISCYNRHREVRLGDNGYGDRPRLAKRLHPETLAVIEAGNVRVVCQEMVLSPAEVVMLMARSARGPMAFGRAGVDWR